MRASTRYDSDVDGLELRYVLSPAEDVSHHAHVEALSPHQGSRSRHSTLSIVDMTMLQEQQTVDCIESGIVVKQEWHVESEPR